MTQMIDTEGAEIPQSAEGRTYFDADLCNWNDGQGPSLSINIPMFFQGENGIDYDSEGVLTVPVQAVFEEYLDEFKEIDGGEGLPEFVQWLRGYADRLEAAGAEQSEFKEKQ